MEGGFLGGDVTAGMMGQQKTVQMRMNRVSVLSQAFQAARTAPAGVAAIFFGCFRLVFSEDSTSSLATIVPLHLIELKCPKRPREAL